MGKIIVVTGGAGSGKSSYAEELAKGLGKDVLYVATALPFDDEMKLRISRHKKERPFFWETIEAYSNLQEHLKNRIEGKPVLLLDCITLMISNILFEAIGDWSTLKTHEIEEAEAAVKKEVNMLLEFAQKGSFVSILVTNEVGMGIVPESAAGRIFRDIAGRVNQLLAKAAEEVYFCVSGIPVRIK